MLFTNKMNRIYGIKIFCEQLIVHLINKFVAVMES